MTERATRPRMRTVGAALTALSFVGVAALAGCSGEGSGDGVSQNASAAATSSPSPSPSPSPPLLRLEPEARVHSSRRGLHHPGLRRLLGAGGLPRGVLGDRERQPGAESRCAAARPGEGRGPQLEPRAVGGPDGPAAGADGAGGEGAAGAGHGDDGRERRLPGLGAADDARGGLPGVVRGVDAAAAGRGAHGAGVRLQRAGPEAALVDRAAGRGGQEDLEPRCLPVDAGGRGRPGARGRGSAGRGAGPGGGVQRGAAGRLREGPALPVRRRGGLRLPLHRGAAEPVGLVPPQPRRPGPAGGDRLPEHHGGRTPA